MLSLFGPTYHAYSGVIVVLGFVSLSIVLCHQRTLLLAVQQKLYSGEDSRPSLIPTHLNASALLLGLHLMHTLILRRTLIWCSHVGSWPLLLTVEQRALFFCPSVKSLCVIGQWGEGTLSIAQWSKDSNSHASRNRHIEKVETQQTKPPQAICNTLL